VSVWQQISQLDEIAVGVPEIDGKQGAGCANAANGSVDDLDSDIAQVPDYLVKGRAGQKAEVGTARLRSAGMRLKLLSRQVEIDLLLTETEGDPSVAVDDLFHGQGPAVEKDRGQDIAYCQYQVIKTVKLHGFV